MGAVSFDKKVIKENLKIRMVMMAKIITILIPVYNEQDNLILLYSRLKKIVDHELQAYSYEILFVNDGSKDGSLSMINELKLTDSNIRYVNLSRNYGKEVALAAGLDYAIGDAVVIIDADLQDPPELIPEMVRYYEEGYDDVYAKRKSRRGESWAKKQTSKWFYRTLKAVSRVPIQEDTGDFRLISRRGVEALKHFRECHRYTKGYFSLIGFNKKEIMFDRDPRYTGETKWNYLKLFELAIEGITSFTSVPLKLSTYFGFVAALLSLVYMIIIIIQTLLYGNAIPGYPSLVCLILFIGGIQLISLGIIGEYLGRIFDETKNRPLYFVDEYR
jgi:glycosyltransferase involved in cell wall biosynthesis